VLSTPELRTGAIDAAKALAQRAVDENRDLTQPVCRPLPDRHQHHRRDRPRGTDVLGQLERLGGALIASAAPAE
jgi:hypothetical protein